MRYDFFLHTYHKMTSCFIALLLCAEDKFATHDAFLESQFKSATVGLMTAEAYKQQRQIVENAEAASAQAAAAAAAAEAEIAQAAKRHRAAQQKQDMSFLSFDADGDDGDADFELPLPKSKAKSKPAAEATAAAVASAEADSDKPAANKPAGKVTVSKDPTAATDFLPDRAREEEEAALRRTLEAQWAAKVEAEKKEVIEIVYSYWDGSGHRNVIRVTKGSTIEQFLDKVRATLSDRFSELRKLSAESMMYIKEDLIIPHHYTFHDLIVTKARGKSGPLFCFDVHEDVRLLGDARVEKDESHAGKVLTRAWYERNKHIFPATRWEVYDPAKTYDKYTIHGREVR